MVDDKIPTAGPVEVGGKFWCYGSTGERDCLYAQWLPDQARHRCGHRLTVRWIDPGAPTPVWCVFMENRHAV